MYKDVHDPRTNGLFRILHPNITLIVFADKQMYCLLFRNRAVENFEDILKSTRKGALNIH